MNSIYAQGGIDVALERNWTVGLQAAYSQGRPCMTATSETVVYDLSATHPDSLLLSANDERTKSNRLNLNFHTDKTWGDKGRKMTWDVDYLRDKRNENSGFLSNTQTPDGAQIPGSNFDYNYLQNRKVDVFSSALDFTLPFEKYKITTGAKVSFTDTRTTGISEAKNTTDKHDYTRLFPTAYFLYSPSESHTLNLSFSNRISRPSQSMVNPFPFYQNKYTYACGREDLKPSYTYNAELGYTLKNNFNVSAYYSYSDDIFFQVIGLNPETNMSSFLWENFMTTHSFGLNNSYTFRTKWLQAYAQHGVSYSRTTSSAPTTSPKEEGWAYNASLRNTIYFNEKKTFVGTLSGSFTSRCYQGVHLMQPNYSVSAGLMYRMLDNKLSLSLNVNDIFTSSNKAEAMSNNLKMTVDNKYSFTNVRIGVSYTFGGDIRSKGQRNSNGDIQQRL